MRPPLAWLALALVACVEAGAPLDAPRDAGPPVEDAGPVVSADAGTAEVDAGRRDAEAEDATPAPDAGPTGPLIGDLTCPATRGRVLELDDYRGEPVPLVGVGLLRLPPGWVGTTPVWIQEAQGTALLSACGERPGCERGAVIVHHGVAAFIPNVEPAPRDVRILPDGAVLLGPSTRVERGRAQPRDPAVVGARGDRVLRLDGRRAVLWVGSTVTDLGEVVGVETRDHGDALHVELLLGRGRARYVVLQATGSAPTVDLSGQEIRSEWTIGLDRAGRPLPSGAFWVCRVDERDAELLLFGQEGRRLDRVPLAARRCADAHLAAFPGLEALLFDWGGAAGAAARLPASGGPPVFIGAFEGPVQSSWLGPSGRWVRGANGLYFSATGQISSATRHRSGQRPPPGPAHRGDRRRGRPRALASMRPSRAGEITGPAWWAGCGDGRSAPIRAPGGRRRRRVPTAGLVR